MGTKPIPHRVMVKQAKVTLADQPLVRIGDWQVEWDGVVVVHCNSGYAQLLPDGTLANYRTSAEAVRRAGRGDQKDSIQLGDSDSGFTKLPKFRRNARRS